MSNKAYIIDDLLQIVKIANLVFFCPDDLKHRRIETWKFFKLRSKWKRGIEKKKRVFSVPSKTYKSAALALKFNKEVINFGKGANQT